MSRNIIVPAIVQDKLAEQVTISKLTFYSPKKPPLLTGIEFLTYIQSFGVNVGSSVVQIQKMVFISLLLRVVFEKHWVLAYERTEQGIIVQDISNKALLRE